MYHLLRYLPRNYLSYAAGAALNCPLPRPLADRAIRLFANKLRIDLSEVEGDLSRYRSIGEFFTRELKAGLRPLASGLLCPVDGTLVDSGEINEELFFDVKGRRYGTEELLRDPQTAARYRRGLFYVLYLSPRDYHHIHSPADGVISRSIHIEGTLWPVNSWSVANIDGVFAANERIVTVLETPDFGAVSVVAVGATNVGSIRLTYDKVCANKGLFLRSKRDTVHLRRYDPPIALNRGERLATFALGSTVILLVERGKRDSYTRAGSVKYGQSLGVSSA